MTVSALCWALLACTDGTERAAGAKTPTATPATTPATAPATGEVLWRSAPYGDGDFDGDLQQVDGGLVAMTPTATSRLDGAGHPHWTAREPDQTPYAAHALVVDGMIVRSYRPDSSDWDVTRVRALDGSTGEVVWSRDGLDNLRTADDRLYATMCQGKESTCRLLALEPSSGTVTWEVPMPAIADIELSGDAVIATSYPGGTDRTQSPYGARTQVDIIDRATGESAGVRRFANSFTVAHQQLIEHSYLGSSGDACILTLIARSFRGKQLWDHDVRWTKAPDDADCALAPLVQPTGTSVELSGVPKHHEEIDLRTGRATPADNSTVVASTATIEVQVQGDDVVALDAAGNTIWETSGSVAGTTDSNFVVIDEPGHDNREQSVIRAITTGQVVFRTAGRYLNSGEGWVAVFRRNGDFALSPGRLALVAWPH